MKFKLFLLEIQNLTGIAWDQNQEFYANDCIYIIFSLYFGIKMNDRTDENKKREWNEIMKYCKHKLKLSNFRMGPGRFADRQFTDTQFTDSRFTDKTVHRQDSSPTGQFTYTQFTDIQFTDSRFTDRTVQRQINFWKNNEIQHKLRQN